MPENAAKVLSEIVERWFDISVAGADFGYCEKLAVEAKPLKRDIKVFGRKVGSRNIGVELKVSFLAQQVKKANIGKAFPWYTGTGHIPLCPTAMDVDDYTYAVALVLHPRDKGADTTEDICITKAVATGNIKLEEGEQDTTIPMEFEARYDRSQFPTYALGTIGSGGT